ncbi:MAG: hypothetical protein LWX70_06785 [Sphingobacteriia bacterium]|nr:hypothetical protein [Sphingobacteriia bacterium]
MSICGWQERFKIQRLATIRWLLAGYGQNSKFKNSKLSCWRLAAGQMPDVDASCKMPDARCQMLDARC